MSVESVREEFLASNRFCVLGTLRKDGRARLSPMAYVYDNGTIYISTTRTRGLHLIAANYSAAALISASVIALARSIIV